MAQRWRVTRELVAWPQSQEWLWRLSVAEVQSNGAFSRFTGVQRWFAVLSGAGVRLFVSTQGQTRMHELHTTSAPFAFDGGVSVECDLIEGPTQDFNLMTRQARTRSRMLRVQDTHEQRMDAPKVIAIYAIDTRASVEFNQNKWHIQPQTLMWRHCERGDMLKVEAANALWMEIELMEDLL